MHGTYLPQPLKVICGPYLNPGTTDIAAPSAPKSPILCSLLHIAKNHLIGTTAICLAKKAFHTHSYPGLHMYISLPGETEVVYILKVLIVTDNSF